MRAHASDAISTENRAERDDTNVDEGVEEDAKDDEETTRWHRRLLAAADTPCSEHAAMGRRRRKRKSIKRPPSLPKTRDREQSSRASQVRYKYTKDGRSGEEVTNGRPMHGYGSATAAAHSG